LGSADQNVKIGLTIQEDGEPEAFDKAAQGVSELAGKAGEAEPSLASLAEGLAALGSAAEGTAEAKDAFVDFATSLKDFANSDSLEGQKAAVDSALEAWKRFGEEVPDLLDKSDEAAKKYRETLDQLTEQQRKLGDPIEQSLGRAQTAFENLEEATKNSLGTAAKKLPEAKQRIDDYRKAIDDARKAGEHISDGQLAELARLEKGYASAQNAVARFGATKKDVQRQLETSRAATDGEVRSITSLRDVASEASPAMGKLAIQAAAVVGAFEAGYAAGEKIRSVLNALTGGEFDRNIQAWFHLAEAADAATAAIEGEVGAEELANQRRIFMQKGLQGFALDVEKNRAILDQLAHGNFELKAAQDALAVSTHKLAEAHGVDEAALNKQAKSLEASILAFARANKQLTSDQIGKLFKDSLQPILDGYEKLGKQAPENLQRLAAQWGVVTSAVDKHRSAVARIVEQITGIALKSKAELAQAAKDVEDAFSHINVGKLNTEELARARKEVQDLIDSYSQAGERIPASLQKIALQVGAFQNEADLMTHKVDNVRTGLDKLAESANKAGAATESAGTASGAAAVSVGKLEQATARHVKVVTELDEKTGKMVKVIQDAGEAQAAAAASTHLHVEEVTKTAQVFQASGEEISRTTTRVKELTTANDGAAGSAEKHAEGVRQLRNSLQEETDLLARYGEGAGVTKQRLDELTEAEKRVAAEDAAVIGGLQHVGVALDDLKERAGRLREGLQGIFDPLLSDMATVLAKAVEVSEAIGGIAGTGLGKK